jgi:hypothetical protein
VEDKPGDDDRHYLVVLDGGGIAVAGFGVHPAPGGYCIDGNFLRQHNKASLSESFESHRALDPTVFRNPSQLADLVSLVVGEIESGGLTSHDQAHERFNAVLAKKHGRTPAKPKDS